MTYQGARARPLDGEEKRYFSVSKVRLSSAGSVTHVLWSEVNPASNGDVGPPVVVPVAEVVEAIHGGAHVAAIFLPPHAHLPECAFEVIERWDGSQTIDLVKRAGATPNGVANIQNLATLAEDPPPREVRAYTPRARAKKTYAVSQVALDEDGRVTDVRWGSVNTVKNVWAGPEVIAPVADVVAALQAGDRVFALFPSVHGHLPDRQFAQADYDGGRQTIVLVGPTAYEREIHHMDRIG